MKAEYIPPREDVIMQNEAPDDLYIIVSGEVEIISCEMDRERVLWTLRSGDMFGEVGALCCRPQCFTYRTKILTQVLRLKTSALFESMKTRHEDNVTMIKNFLQVSYLTISSYPPSETGSFFFRSFLLLHYQLDIYSPLITWLLEQETFFKKSHSSCFEVI